MKLRHTILTILLAAVSLAAGAQETSTYNIAINGVTGSTEDKPYEVTEAVSVDNVKFAEPTITVRNSSGTAVTSNFDLKYYINGCEDEDKIEQRQSPISSSTDKVDMSVDNTNLWYIEVVSGNFYTGFYSGTAKIHVIAYNKGTTTKACEGWYQVKVEPLPVTLTIYPKEETVYKNFKFQLPTAKVTYGSTDITSYYEPNRIVPSGLTADASDGEIMTGATAGTYQVTWDFKGKTIDGKDYSRHYAEVKATADITVLDEEKPTGNVSVTMAWSGASSQTVGNFKTITLPYPNVTTTITTKDSENKDVKHTVLLNNIFRYNYEIVSAVGTDGTTALSPTLTTTDNGKTWTLTPDGYGTITLKVTNMDGSDYTKAPSGYAQKSENYIVYVSDQTINVTVTPPSADIPGSWVITNQSWSLPQYSATTHSSVDYTNNVTWYFGIPDGAKTTLDDDPDLTGGEQRTIDGITYKFYPILRGFEEGDIIDLTEATARKFQFWAKPIDTSMGDGGFGEQTLTLTDKLKPEVKTSYNDIVANIKGSKDAGWTMLPMHTPNLRIKSSTGIDISQYYDVTYSLDKDASAAGFTIDATTGEVSYSYTGDAPVLTNRTITYTVTPKSATSIYDKGSVTVTIHPSQAGFAYEVITTDGSNYGKLHFTAAGTLGTGTRINAVPGIDIRFGTATADDGSTWSIAESSTYKDDVDGNSDGALLVSSAKENITVDDDKIPTKGTYYVLIPYTNGKLTTDAVFENGKTYRLVCKGSTPEEYTPTADGHESHDWTTVLMAGETYYLYQTDGAMKLHGINFTPGYVEGGAITGKSAIVYGGYGGTNSTATIISSPTSSVTFDFKKDGVNYSSYATINASTGEVTPKRNSQGLGEDSRVPIEATITNNELGTAVKKTAVVRLRIISVPSYVVIKGQTIDPGSELHPSITENGITTVSSDITLTAGGWTGTYRQGGNDRTDIFKAADADESGDNGGSIDGFRYRSFGDRDTYNENVAGFTNYRNEDKNSDDGDYVDKTNKHSSFDLPVYGTYLKIEGKKSGRINVYICQNGALDYAGVNLEILNSNRPQNTQVKWRPMFITDETGNVISGVEAKTNSTLKVAYNDARVKNYALNNPVLDSQPAVFLGSVLNDKSYNDCTFSWYRFGPDSKEKNTYLQEDAKKIYTAWKNATVGSKMEPIQLQQGITFINKAYVRYTFHVYPGKSYFMWMSGSKLGLAGFSFISDESLADQTSEIKTIDMNDYEDEAKTASMTFGKFFEYVTVTNKVPLAETTTSGIGIYPGFNVNIKRKFGKDKWTSICLPFSVNETQFEETFGENALIMTYDHISKITDSQNDRYVVHLIQHAKRMIEANRPYFICPSKTMSDDAKKGITINGLTIQSNYSTLPSSEKAPADGLIFATDQSDDNNSESTTSHIHVGTMQEVTAPKGSFVMAGTRLYHITADGGYKVPPFRSYIKEQDSNSGSGAKNSIFTTEVYDVATGTYLDIDDTPTCIEGTGTDDNNSTQTELYPHGVFNLAGQKVAETIADHLPRGVYIVNGKKVVVR